MNFFPWDPAPRTLGAGISYPMWVSLAVAHLMAQSQVVGVITYLPFMSLRGMQT